MSDAIDLREVRQQITYNILAVDPGHTCGWALLNRSGRVSSDECNVDAMCDNVFDTITQCRMYSHPLAIAIERANVNSNKGGRGILRSLSWEMETIGWAKNLCRRNEIPFLQVNKSDAAHFGSDEVLKQLGWWHEGGAGHANDAFRILTVATAQWSLDYWTRLVLDKGILES